MASGHGAEWCRDEMRREWDVVHLGEMRDLAALGKSAALWDVRHDDVRPLLLEQFAKAPSQIEVFADANRRAAAHADLLERFDVLGRNRLLEPEQIEPLHRGCDPACARDVVAGVEI